MRSGSTLVYLAARELLTLVQQSLFGAAANPVAAASLGGRNRDMLSTKEYIADISRRMNLDAEAAEAAAGKAARMGF